MANDIVLARLITPIVADDSQLGAAIQRAMQRLRQVQGARPNVRVSADVGSAISNLGRLGDIVGHVRGQIFSLASINWSAILGYASLGGMVALLAKLTQGWMQTSDAIHDLREQVQILGLD